MAHRWYAIQTYSGSELTVKRALLKLADELANDKISEVAVPTEDLIEIKKGKKVLIERPLYPAYAFANIDLDTALWHRIQSMPRVGRFIGEAKKPTALSEKDINLILEKVKNRAAARPKVSFENGEVVRITEGSFSNFSGIVDDFDLTSGMLTLTVSIFGRNTPVEISYTQVERVV